MTAQHQDVDPLAGDCGMLVTGYEHLSASALPEGADRAVAKDRGP
jgi:hypothetical protein